MKTLKLVPSTPDFKFVRYNRRAFVFSSVMIIGSLLAFLMQGLNFGIDFKGGILVEISSSEPVDIAGLRGRMQTLDLGEVQIQQFGTPTDVLIRVAEADVAQHPRQLLARKVGLLHQGRSLVGYGAGQGAEAVLEVGTRQTARPRD